MFVDVAVDVMLAVCHRTTPSVGGSVVRTGSELVVRWFGPIGPEPPVGFPQDCEGFRYAAAGWSAVIISNAAGESIAALLCRRRVL